MHSSQTHCQAAQTNATIQAWQRVCLPHRTTKTTDKPTAEKEQRKHNTWYSACGFQWFANAYGS